MLIAVKIAREQPTVYQIVLVLLVFFLVKGLIVIDSLLPGLQTDEIFILCVSRARVCRKSSYTKGNNPILIKNVFRTNGMSLEFVN